MPADAGVDCFLHIDGRNDDLVLVRSGSHVKGISIGACIGCHLLGHRHVLGLLDEKLRTGWGLGHCSHVRLLVIIKCWCAPLLRDFLYRKVVDSNLAIENVTVALAGALWLSLSTRTKAVLRGRLGDVVLAVLLVLVEVGRRGLPEARLVGRSFGPHLRLLLGCPVVVFCAHLPIVAHPTWVQLEFLELGSAVLPLFLLTLL